MSLISSHAALAITGIGVISPFGVSESEAVKVYNAGKSLIKIRSIDDAPTAVAPLSPSAEETLEVLLTEREHYKRLDRSTLLAIAASRGAMQQAQWESLERDKLGVCIGTSRGATGLLEQYFKAYLASARKRTPALTSPTTTFGNISSWVAQDCGAQGAANTVSCTCSSALMALASAAAWIRSGMCERFIVGGAEAPLTPFTVAQLRSLGLYSKDTDSEFPCRPFAAEGQRRDQLVLGEGGCVLAVEQLKAGPEKMPKHTSFAVIESIGFGSESLSSSTSISDEGEALAKAMRHALQGMLTTDKVDAIVAHAPGTALGDAAELAAIKDVFAEREIPTITSNKWCFGHTLGASGALSLQQAILLLAGKITAALPYRTCLRAAAPPQQHKKIMVNSTGFGGGAVSVVLSHPYLFGKI